MPLINGRSTQRNRSKKDVWILADPEDVRFILSRGRQELPNGYILSTSTPKTWLHRAILERKLGRRLLDEEECDHVHHKLNDVRRSELRAATRQQNVQNRKGPTSGNKASGFRGVRWHRKSRLWHAQAHTNGKCYSGGYHKTPEAANRAAIALRTRLGFLDSTPPSPHQESRR